jgi:hypothetical protein
LSPGRLSGKKEMEIKRAYVGKTQKLKKKGIKKTIFKAKMKNKVFLDMEVIIGRQGNPVFGLWLDHIHTSISTKNYTSATSFWFSAKARYVLHTTGPHSMNKFLNLATNKITNKKIEHVAVSYFKDCKTLTEAQREKFDVISYESNSWFTSEHRIDVKVGDGKSSLPAKPVRKRIYRFPAVCKASVTCTESCSKSPVSRDEKSIAQGSGQVNGLVEKLVDDEKQQTGLDEVTCNRLTAKTENDLLKQQLAEEFKRVCSIRVENELLKRLLVQERSLAGELRVFLYSTTVDSWDAVMEPQSQLPLHIRDWLAPTSEE